MCEVQAAAADLWVAGDDEEDPRQRHRGDRADDEELEALRALGVADG